MKTRRLTAKEVAVLEGNGCAAESWSTVLVRDDFIVDSSLRDVYFSGNVSLGVFAGTLLTSTRVPQPCGLYSCRLHNVRIGDNCRIANSTVSNTDIGPDCLVEQVAGLARSGDQPFGNGCFAHVLAEDGARSIPLWRGLTAQVAHLACHFKGHAIGEALERMALRDAESLRLPRSHLGRGCRLERCGLVDNVWLGDGVRVHDAARLDNCMAEGGPVPARIGSGVSARHSIFQGASRVDSGVRLERCFVGEGVVLENDLYAQDSLFFANAHFGNSEVVGSFLGPYSVSHHRSTLVLACQSLFVNFGSGTNSSNHLYKLGPRHGGILRRGARCGSGSYLLWPSDIGAFSTVVGQHRDHLDTAMFPFSLVLAKGESSVLVPGANLFSVGLFRDAQKWRERDNRSGLQATADLVNAAVFSPYVMESMERGMSLLKRVQAAQGDLRHGGAVIPENRIVPGLTLYRTALRFYVGECILRHLVRENQGEMPGVSDIIQVLERIAANSDAQDDGGWRDWGGMLLSGRDAELVMDGMAVGDIATRNELAALLRVIHDRYPNRELVWAGRRWLREYKEATLHTVQTFVEDWRRSVQFRHERLLKDLQKEFGHDKMIGFGVEADKSAVFRRIRGDVQDYAVTKQIHEQRDRLLALAERLG